MGKQIILALGAIFLLALTPYMSRASHAAGGEISYEWVSDSTYRVYFKFYRDCGGANAPNTVALCYHNSCTSYSNTVTMTRITKLPDSTTNGSPVSTGCAGVGTKCSSSTSPIPGYAEWWYTATVTLPSRCNYWNFSAFVNARNPSVNIFGGSMYVEATLNNLVAQGNSSPYFSVKPVPSVCINQSYTYNNGGVDPDSDSLVFEMASPITGSGSCPYTTSTIAFRSGSPSYNTTNNPIQTNNSFVLDTITGQMTFKPSLTGAATLTTRIKEYRNGVLIGTVMRDIQIQVISCTVTAPVVSTVSNSISGGTYVNGRVEACAGVAMTFCYDMVSTNSSAILIATDNHNAAAPGSSVTYVGQQTDSIRGCFSWTPGTVDTGLRVFTVTVKDSTCNSPGVLVSQTFVLPIYIWPITDILKDTILCYGDTVQLTAVGGSNFTWSVLSGGSSISSLSCTTCKKPYAFPTQSTQYVVSNSTTQFCSKNKDTVTVDVLDIRFDTLQASNNSPVCEGDTLKLYATAAPTGYGYRWTGPGGYSSSARNPVIPNVPASGNGNYLLSSTKLHCWSIPDTTAATVKPRPTKPVATNNGPICAGSTLNVSVATIANATYSWTGPGSFSSTSQNFSIPNADTSKGGNYIITATSTINGCPSEPDTTTAVIHHIPVISSVTSTNPTTCGGYEGSFTLWGLKPSTTYTLNYKKDGVTQSPLVKTTNSAGRLVISSLNAATYSQLKVTLNGCVSDTATATVILTDPKAPIVNATTNAPICEGDTLKLFAAVDSSGTTLSWSGPLAFSSTTQNPVITNATPTHSGAYILTAAKNNCTSVPDTVNVTVHPTPATPVATNNGPLCNGDTILLSATTVTGAIYTWSGPLSFSSNTQNPAITNADTTMSGDYIVFARANGCNSLPDTTTVIVYPTPATPAISSNSPVCEGDTIKLYASIAGAASYSWTGPSSYTSTDQNPVIPNSVPAQSGTYFVAAIVNGCASAQNSIKFDVFATPATPVATNNGPLCTGNTLTLTATAVGKSTTLSWTGPNSFTGTGGTQTITNVQTANSGDYIVIATSNSCVSQPDTTTVVINPLPAPVIGGSSVTHPTSCGASNGSIAFTGLIPSTSYTVNYTKNSIPQSPASMSSDGSGILTISNLTAGGYTNITVTAPNGCTSVPVSLITLSDPTPPFIYIDSIRNTTTCSGSDGSFVIGGLVYDTTYSINYDINTIPQTPLNLTADTGGFVKLSNLAAGQYQNISVTWLNCTSNVINVITIADPNAPVVTATNNTPVCEGDTVKLFAASDSTGITWSWSGPLSFTSTNQNPVIANGIPTQSGVYTLTATKNNCTSDADTTTVTVHPTPATPVANNNGPLCAGSTLQLTSSTVGAATYSWSGPLAFTDTVQNPAISNTDTPNSGNYIVIATENNCPSLADTTVVVIHDVPLVDTFSFTHPTTCTGTEGTITLKGLKPIRTYTVNFKKNTTAQAPQSIATNGTGQLVITGLSAGVYSEITVTLDNCTSDTVTSVTLVDPNAPVVTATNNTPVCQGDTVKLFATSDSTGTTWSWSGPLSFTSTSQNTFIANAIPLQAGVYTVTATKNNCTSDADTTTVIVYPTPQLPGAANNGPLCSGNTINLSADTFAGASYQWTGQLGFTSNSQNPSIANAQPSMSGKYYVQTTINGCISPWDSTTVTIYPLPAPIAGVTTVVHPSTCNGTDGQIIISGLDTNATYGLDYKKNGITQTPLNITTNSSGVLTIANLSAGNYSYVTVTSTNGCSSDTLPTFVLTDPVPPVISIASTTNPSTCLGSDGFVVLDGFQSNKAYTLSYQKNTVAQTPVALTSTTSGTLVLPGLTKGTYDSFRVEIYNCYSNYTGPVTLSDPNAPVVQASNNTPICEDDNLQLYGSSDSTGVTWSWSGPLSYTSTSRNPVISNAVPAQSGVYTLTAEKNNCTSASDTTNVIVHPTPATPVANNNGPLCSGSTLQLTSSTVGAATYSWTGPLSFSSSLQNPTISNTDTPHTGNYIVIATENNCPSEPDTTAVIVYDVPLIDTFSYTHPTTCSGTEGTITLHGLKANVTYTVAYKKNNIAQAPVSITTNTSGQLVINGLGAGLYTAIDVTQNNCTSDTVAGILLTDPNAPVINTWNNTPVCQDDSVMLFGNSDSTGVTWSWSGPLSFSSSIQNPVIPNAVPAQSGMYILYATKNNCTSTADTTIVIVHPTPATPVAANNGPLCTGDTLQLTSSTVGAATYSWSGPVSFTSTVQNPVRANVDTPHTGQYVVIATENNCPSEADTTTVIVYDVPVIGTRTFTHPTTCGGTEGTITITGLKPNTTYTLNYNKNSIAQPPGPITTNSSGVAVIPNLSAGIYGGISFTQNNCSSVPLKNITLLDPDAPVVTATNNTPVCEDDTVKLYGMADSVGVTWSWSGPLSYSSSNQDPVIANALPTQSGIYVLTATKNNCTSAGDTTVVVVHPTPATPVAGSNSPICAGSTLQLTSSTVGSATYTWSGPLSFTSALQNPSIVNTDTSMSGKYFVIATENNCTSLADTATVIIHHIPKIDTYSYTHPTTCGGIDGTITVTGLVGNATYTVTHKKNSVAQSAQAINTNGSGILTINGLGAGIYTGLTVTLNNCTSDSIATIILNDPNAPTVVATNNTPVCQGDNFQLTGSADSTGVTWSWSGPLSYTSTTQSPVVSGALPAMSGIYILAVTKNNCTGTDTTNVLVHPTPPTPSSSNNGPLCSGDNLQLSAININGATYSWTGPNSYTANTQNPSVTNVDTSLSGKYSVIATVNGCVSAADTTTVVIYHTPSISVSSFTHPTSCGGTQGTISLNGLVKNTSFTVTYKKNGTLQSAATLASNGSGVLTIGGLGSGTYDSIRVSFNNCPSNTVGPVVLTDPVAPQAFAANNTPICEGDTIKLTGQSDSTGVTWSWTGPSSFTSATQNPVILNALPTQSGMYLLTVTKNNCASVPDTTYVTVHPTPATPVAGNNGPLCPGDQLNISSSVVTGATYQWTGPLAFTDTARNPVIINAQPTHSGIYSVIATVNGCPSQPGNTTVVVNPTPAAPGVTPAYFYCEDVTAPALTAAGANLLWYTTLSGGIGSATAPVPVTTTAPAFSTWYVSQTVNGCEGPRSKIDVTIHQKPLPPLVTPTIEYCQFEIAAPLTANGTQLKWYVTQTGGTGSVTPPTPPTSVIITNRWYVTQTDNNGCESDKNTIDVSIIPNINSDVIVTDDTICQYETIEVYNNVTTPGLQHTWSFDGADVSSGDTSGPYVLNWNDTGVKQVKVAIANELCGHPDSIDIYVSPVPDGSFIAEGSACVSQSITLSPNWKEAVEYSWTLDGGTITGVTQDKIYSANWNTPGDKVIVLVVVSKDGCLSSPNTHMVSVHDNPVAQIEYVSSYDVCAGDTITVRTDANNTYEYTWSGTNTLLNSKGPLTYSIVTVPGAIVLQALNEWGCEDYDTVAVTAHKCCEIALPNAFSPNNDGLNDRFRIITDGNQTIGTFIITNRWGQKLFETNNPLEGWDGTYKGVRAELGTYYYYIKYTCTTNEVFEKKGEVILIR